MFLISSLLRTVFLFGFPLVLAGTSVQAQYDHRVPGYTDPEQLAITATRQRLEQDERNMRSETFCLGEFELRASNVRRQLEAISLMPVDEISSRQQESATAMGQELKALERHIEARKNSLATDARMLAERRRQLAEQEMRYKLRIASDDPRPRLSPEDEYRARVLEQNERIRQDMAERQAQVELQNQRLMYGPVMHPQPGPVLLDNSVLPGPADSGFDIEELGLCEMLEKKVSDTNYDIAEINLLAAKGLPGSENLDVEKTLKTLDLWAAWVKHETDRHLYRFQKAPEEYGSSEAYFRILMMVCTLQADFGICYNKDPKMRAGPVEIIPNDFTFFSNSQDLFVHGLTEGQHQGTCASLPVFYVAVGRRLGYPLKLVECKGHLFVRWEDAKERFNIEGTSRGLNCYPDAEYMEWPWPISKEELETGMYMVPLSPKRELSAFLEMRALCLKQNKCEKQHVTAKSWADRLRKEEGVDLDRLNQLRQQQAQKVGSVSPRDILTNTNTWRDPGNERGAPGRRTIFATDRFDSE